MLLNDYIFLGTNILSPYFHLTFPVPTQDNSFDCGVFVCRYAYAIYQLRERNFTYADAGMYCDMDDERNQSGLYHLITLGASFDFNMDDIVRFREEFKTLLRRLSVVYWDTKRNGGKSLAIPGAGDNTAVA